MADASRWKCRDCIAHGFEEDFRDVPRTLASKRRSSAPKMARDLLPAARGGIKPDSHSVFNTLILDEDPMDGSRSLRKRKSPSDEPRPNSRRKRRSVDTDSTHEEPRMNGIDGADDESVTERPQRQKGRKGARIVSRSDEPKSAVVAFNVTPAQWEEIEKNVQKKQRRRERDRLRRARNQRARTATVEADEIVQHPALQTTMYTNPFYAFPDRENDELKGKPYGGILNEAEADTTRTYPQDLDREAFQHARNVAEDKWKDKIAHENGDVPARPAKGGLPSKIKCINFGGYEIDTWHAAPYPEEYSRNKHLYICEFCLKYMSSDYVAWRHKLKCSAKHPPGDEIYRSKITNPETGKETYLSFYEVDGRRNQVYCQNLCLLAKLFLGSKTLYYDVEPFLFYIMTENDEYGCHFVGYFSKEKRGGIQPLLDDPSPDFALSNPGNNVSCILVLPVHMRRGFGRTLIEFSYMLTKVEKRTGSPEKPLSDMGLVSYRSYWRGVLCTLLLRYRDVESGSQPITITDIARETGMTPDDIISTLESLRALVRDPITGTYALRLDFEYMQEYADKQEKKVTIKLDPERLCWVPYVMGKPTSYFPIGEEANQPLSTVQPRNEPVEVEDVAESTENLSNGLPPIDTAPSESQSPIKTPNGHISGEASPASNSSRRTSNGPIPPTRYEVFPPVPGAQSAARRRPGRPSRGSNRRSNGSYRLATYRRPGASRRRNDRPRTSGPRRARSKLAEVATAADTEEEIEINSHDHAAAEHDTRDDIAHAAGDVEADVEGDDVEQNEDDEEMDED